MLLFFRNRLLPDNGKPWYVVDTNVLIDCINIIPNGDNEHPQKPTIDLDNANIIIPEVVLDEMDRIVHDDKKPAELKIVVKELLRRIRKILDEDYKPTTFTELFKLDTPHETAGDGRCFYFLPLHKNFVQSLPIQFDENYTDGDILATVITAKLALHGVRVDGKARLRKVEKIMRKDTKVTLLTNDIRFIARALNYGVRALPFEFEVPEPYTGRRDLVVPQSLLNQFLGSTTLPLKDWEAAMPDQPPLIANEYIVMYSSDETKDKDDNLYRRIGYYDVNLGAIVHIRKTHVEGITITNPGQIIYLDALTRPDITSVICQGPAGSGKTYVSTVWSYQACKKNLYSASIVVPRQDDNGLGALPGDLNNKMDIFVQPIKDSLRSLFHMNYKKDQKRTEELAKLEKKESSKSKKHGHKRACEDDEAYEMYEKTRNKKTQKNNRNSSKANDSPMRRIENNVQSAWERNFQVVPIANAQGRSFLGQYVFCDEFQDQNIIAAKTMTTRLGEGAKLVLVGDIDQIHAPHVNRGNSGLTFASMILKGNPLAAQVAFLSTEVKRSEFAQLVVQALKKQGAKEK